MQLAQEPLRRPLQNLSCAVMLAQRQDKVWQTLFAIQSSSDYYSVKHMASLAHQTAPPAIHKASVLAFLCLCVAQPAFSATPATAKGVTWQPPKLMQGSPVLFQVPTTPTIQSVKGSWLGHEVTFFREGGKTTWYGLGGASLETAPGNYELRVTETLTSGKALEIRRQIKISRGVYPNITIKVSKQYTEPSSEQLTQVAADKELKQRIFATESPHRLWSGQFAPPVSAGISDVFGTARVFNQEVKSRHQGLDFAAPTGSPVAAINSGKVILASPLYFEGNCVVIDHGQGLLSLYLHLSEFKVKEGDEVESGQLIALSGGTGRATGPHLHLAIRWQGVYLDPAILLKLNTP
jgi:murein DD-endopeptidase MepM/ murein hydrolase activator NlpD